MDQPSKMENLQFAQGILRELRQKAEADGEKLLTYLIDMAYLEASDRIRALGPAVLVFMADPMGSDAVAG
ncbi:MAG: hypothetical protein E5W99_25085, partial [Mesorhizobium sp.]